MKQNSWKLIGLAFGVVFIVAILLIILILYWPRMIDTINIAYSLTIIIIISFICGVIVNFFTSSDNKKLLIQDGLIISFFSYVAIFSYFIYDSMINNNYNNYSSTALFAGIIIALIVLVFNVFLPIFIFIIIGEIFCNKILKKN